MPKISRRIRQVGGLGNRQIKKELGLQGLEAAGCDMVSSGFIQEFFSIRELAQRWRCSRGSVYNRLRASGAKVVDFASAGKRGSKLVPSSVVREIETRHFKRLC